MRLRCGMSQNELMYIRSACLLITLLGLNSSGSRGSVWLDKLRYAVT